MGFSLFSGGRRCRHIIGLGYIIRRFFAARQSRIQAAQYAGFSRPMFILCNCF